MSNETDLDWLARNVHVWKSGYDLAVVQRGIEEIYVTWPSACSSGITKKEWLARRAELQNKPSWNDAPEWANWLAQDEDGEWWFFSAKPKVQSVSFDEQCSGIRADYAKKGETIGDWRDTLENRPEEFQPFTSIEDNQEKAMKQDNGWHERGELPPVGVACEAYIDYPPQWVEAEIVAHKDGFAIGWCKSVMKGCHGDKASEFRPVRTERDVLLSIIVEEMNRYDTDGKLADAILAAGFKRGGAA